MISIQEFCLFAQGAAVMRDLYKLAEFLFQLSGSCGLQPTMRRCIHVLRGRPDVTSEPDVLKRLQVLLSDLEETPQYTIDGVQRKRWLSSSTFFKADDTVGQPYGLIEHTVSRALDYCSVNSVPVAHVHYDAYCDSGEIGCCCKNYLGRGEYEQNFWSIAVTETLQSVATLGFSVDLAVLFLCDLLFYNPDRHPGNIVVIIGRDSDRLAPVFDLGNSLTFVDEPNYENFVPDPYGVRQLHWALSVLGVKPVFSVTELYNQYNHSVQGYSKCLVDEYLERVLLCSEFPYVRKFWEIV